MIKQYQTDIDSMYCHAAQIFKSGNIVKQCLYFFDVFFLSGGRVAGPLPDTCHWAGSPLQAAGTGVVQQPGRLREWRHRVPAWETGGTTFRRGHRLYGLLRARTQGPAQHEQWLHSGECRVNSNKSGDAWGWFLEPDPDPIHCQSQYVTCADLACCHGSGLRCNFLWGHARWIDCIGGSGAMVLNYEILIHTFVMILAL